MEKKLEVKNLVISFRTPGGKVQAVRDISFNLYKGETLAIVGESGSGKSVTNRAIMGISAGNAIVEKGEIIYDGQDLLKISEEDFHKIRGDKIAMIFQDPMSSLNPIMKVGQQLTEAMLLKGSASQRAARKSFNTTLALLRENMDEVYSSEEDKKVNEELCKTFDNFCIAATKIESAYNEANRNIAEAKSEIEYALFIAEKKAEANTKDVVEKVINHLKHSYNEFLVDNLTNMASVISGLEQECKLIKTRSGQYSEKIVELFKEANAILEEVMAFDVPNFFCLGYYTMRNPEFDVTSMLVKDLNVMTRKYIDEEFMNKFLERASKALENGHKKSVANKQNAINELRNSLEYFGAEEIERKQSMTIANNLIKLVENAIDHLEIVKDSVAFTFRTSIIDAINTYFDGIKNNPREQARFEKQSAKRQAIVDSGKVPEWNVVPAALVNLETARQNIRDIISNVIEDFEERNSDKGLDFDSLAVSIVDFFKEQASHLVYKVTKRIAKIRAIKLLEEVGLPEPELRYNQYPFEFSGGMRQRIVIAIALAANPDILICDEPTTALDVTIQSQILELINRIKKERNLSVIFITHDLGVVANMADRIAVMYAGKIVEYGSVDDIFYNPRHPYTWALLSSMPDLDTKEKLEAIPGTPPNMIFPPKGDAFAARNKYAMAIDFEQQPPLFEVSEGHYAATWLLHPNAPKVEPPRIVTERIERMTKKMNESKVIK